LRLPAAMVLILVALVCVACSGGDKEAGPSQSDACVAPTPFPDTSKLGKLPLDLWGTITLVEQKRGFVGAEAISELQIVELYPQMVRDLGDRDYVYLGGENEGFEAELAFSSPDGRLASFALRETDCKQHIRIRVLIENGTSNGNGGGS
jgi:hypothetical protein